MSYFKRFTNFCAGFTAFHAIIYLIGQFMSFNPTGDPNMTEKIKLFLAPDHQKSHREYLVLIILLVLSAVAGRIFERAPYISLVISLAPLAKILLLFGDEKLFDRPMLYIILGLLHVSGNVIHAVILDRADGRRRAAICVHIFGICAFAASLWLMRQAKELLSLEEEAVAELGRLDLTVLAGAENGAHEIILKLGIFILSSVTLSIILRDIYFIDAILSILPFGYCVYLIATGKLTLFPAIILAATFLYFSFRLLLLFAEPMAKRISLPWRRKTEQKKHKSF